MQRKKMLSACIAMALSGQTWAADISLTDISNDTRRNGQITCPSDVHSLSKEQLKQLPSECKKKDENTLIPWLAVGATALTTAIAIYALNDDYNNHHDIAPIPPTPPDDGGDVTPTPPDDGGDVTPTPPEPQKPRVFDNRVTLDEANGTLQIRDTTFTYRKNDDGSYTLIAPDGRTTPISGWDITEASNTIEIRGASPDGNIEWTYDDDSMLYVTKHNGVVIDDIADTLSFHISNVVVDDKGGNTALNGATVMEITGDNITINNEGDTVASGTGSVVGVLTGDDITINNIGDTTVDGGTAAIVNGNHATINNQGNTTVTNGGTGSHTTGDNATVDNTGTMTVDGTNSTGTLVDGNGAIVKQKGDLYVSGGAHGIEINGDRAQIGNTGNIYVTDADSVGVLINGDNAAFANVGNIDVSNSGIGVSATGDYSTIALAGDMQVGDFATGLDVSGNGNSITMDTDALDITGQMATGVAVSGDSNTVKITGDITVDKDQTADNAADYFDDPSMGVNVTGNNNNVTLDGSLTLVVDSEKTSRKVAEFDGTQETAVGLNVVGDGNYVTLNGDLAFIGESGVMEDAAGTTVANTRNYSGHAPMVNIDGDSAVYLNGDTVVSGEFPVGMRKLMTVHHGGYLELSDSATFTTKNITQWETYAEEDGGLIYVDSGGQFVNGGNVDIQDIGLVEADDIGSLAVNNGTINLGITDNVSAAMPISMMIAGNGATVVNNGKIIGQVLNLDRVRNLTWYYGVISPMSFNNNATSMMGISAVYGPNSYALNGEYGEIEMYGRGTTGMYAVNKGTVENAGKITVDTLWKDANDTTTVSGGVPNGSPIDYGVGMAAGTTAGYDNTYATAINDEGGVITIYNAGAGMAVTGSTNVVINRGTINLEHNENYDTSLGNNKLVGMAVYNGGTAVNDQTGIINIDVAEGKAFYNGGSGTIINYGMICYLGNCENKDEYNKDDPLVSTAWRDGDIITAEGKTLDLPSTGGITDPVAISAAYITNAGTVTGGAITVSNKGYLTNKTTGDINEVDIAVGGEYTNQGTTATVSVDGGIFNNEGTVTGQVGTTVAGSVINNSGSFTTVEQWASTFYNTGYVKSWKGASGSAVVYNQDGGTMDTATFNATSTFNNEAGATVSKVTFSAAGTFNNAGTVTGASVDKGGTFNNLESGVVTMASDALWTGYFNNWGTVEGNIKIATGGDGHTLYNAGVINGQIQTNTTKSKAINDGTINIDKTGNVAMSAHGSAKMINNGEINVGTVGTDQTGMIGMQLESNATADAVIENNGTINIYANDSYAFSKLGANGHIVNNGTVVIAEGVTGSGLIKQTGTAMEGSGEGGDGTEVHYVDFTAPNQPTIVEPDNVSNASSASSGMNDLTGYVVGTNADGSTGKLMVNNASMSGVGINTGFTAGTADTIVSFDNVVEGSNLTDASAITSTSVVWSAQGSTDASGNVDITMTKKAYTDVATDSTVSDVAKALDTGYTNNELYTSLNVGSTAELNSALKQISGSQANTVFREARILSNRFSMLSDAAPQMSNGLAFNVVAKGDPRAELGNDTQYDMLALRKTLNLTENQNLGLEYGIARLDGNGSDTAGDNGVTGGYSQFFGLKHRMAFDNGMSWNNALRYDVHNLDSSRSVAYGNVNKTADSSVKQQYLEFRSEGAKAFELTETLKVTPYAGIKLRHTLEDGYRERSAGDFNLNMNSGSETAVDSIVGLKLNYVGQNGWSANATLEGGPNLSYTKSQRSATLMGAGSQRFNVDDSQQGGGINSFMTVGMKYSGTHGTLNLDAFNWKEDGVSDRGFILNIRKTF